MEFKNLHNFLTTYANNIHSIYTGELRSEGYRLADKVSVDVVLFENEYRVTLNLEDYWKYIEYGRKPGKMPPIDTMLEWVRRRGIRPRDPLTSERSLAFLIARKIGREGIQPKRLLERSIELATDDFRKDLIAAWRLDIKEHNLKYIKLKD